MKRVWSERLISNWHKSTILTRIQMGGYVKGEGQDFEGEGQDVEGRGRVLRGRGRVLRGGAECWRQGKDKCIVSGGGCSK